MKPKKKIGVAEFEILAYVASHGEVPVRQVADHFAETKGLVRTTVLKTMDRLREKGFLTRVEKEGVFHYSSTQSRAELESMLIDRFVRDTLGGSLTPFVAYMHGQTEVSEEELRDLKNLVAELESRRKL